MIISSENFAKTCDVVLDPHYNPQMLITTRSPRRVFVTGERMIFEQVLYILKSFETKYELVYHRTDSTFDRFKFESVKPFVSKIYAVNCDISHPMISKIPLGFADGKKMPENIQKNKDILCYLNLGLYNDEIQFVKCKNIRQHCIDFFKNKHFITYDNCNLTQEEFNDKLHRSKFVLCPFGYGLDTHRFYESYASGAIPIVMSSGLDEIYEKFGAIIVNDWSEVTEEFLKNIIKKCFEKEKLYVNNYISDHINLLF